MDVEKKRTFIILSNLINLIISSILIFVSLCFKNKSCIQLICAARFLSRSFEIMPSFVLDVASNSKSSSTSKGERVILAITSYLEIFFLLFVIYFDYHGGKFSETFYNFLQTIFTNSCSCCKENADIDTFVFVFYIVFTATMITHVISNYIKSDTKSKSDLILLTYKGDEIELTKINYLEWTNIKEYICNHCDYKLTSARILIQETYCPDYDSFSDDEINAEEKGISKVLYSIHNDCGWIIGIIYKPLIDIKETQKKQG